jgi:hypothetical protein
MNRHRPFAERLVARCCTRSLKPVRYGGGGHQFFGAGPAVLSPTGKLHCDHHQGCPRDFPHSRLPGKTAPDFRGATSPSAVQSAGSPRPRPDAGATPNDETPADSLAPDHPPLPQERAPVPARKGGRRGTQASPEDVGSISTSRQLGPRPAKRTFVRLCWTAALLGRRSPARIGSDSS